MDDLAENMPAHARAKRGVLIGMVVLTVISTVALWLAAKSEDIAQVITLFTALGYAIGILLWCQLDSMERSIPLGFGFRIFVVLMAVLAVPYYFFKSRGLKEGAVSLGFAFVFYLLLILVASVTNLILSISDGSLDIFK